ncbi:MAG TPA: NUDIX hydrolase [Terriglobales bacterium]|nr:NUDIX hydrolase [Terriglobales bacterium]
MAARFERRGVRTLVAETRRKAADHDELRWLLTEETFVDHEAGAEVHRKILRHPGIVVIVPFVADDRIVLLRQFRFPVGHDGLWELPAGTIEATLRGGEMVVLETALECAGRELPEEAGYRATTMREAARVHMMPGTGDQIATICFATGLERVPVDPDDQEDITEIRAFSKTELRAMIAAREITDAKTLVGLMYALSD